MANPLILALLGQPLGVPPANPSLITQGGQPENVQAIAASSILNQGGAAAFVFQPSGTAVGSVYTTWAALAAAVAATPSAIRKSVTFDPTFAACTVPAGSYPGFDDVSFYGHSAVGIPVPVTFAAGAILQGTGGANAPSHTQWWNLAITFASGTFPTITTTQAQTEFYYCTLTGPGAGSAFNVNGAGGALLIQLFESSFATLSIAGIGAGGGTIDTFLFCGSLVQTATMTGAVGTFAFLVDPSSSVSRTAVSGGASPSFNVFGGNVAEYASADQSVTNSTVPVADTALFFGVQNGETWYFEIEVYCTYVAASGISAGILSTSVAGTYQIMGSFTPIGGTAVAAETSPAPSTNTYAASAGTSGVLSIVGTVKATATGSVNFAFAQTASNATSTVRKAGSYMKASRIALA